MPISLKRCEWIGAPTLKALRRVHRAWRVYHQRRALRQLAYVRVKNIVVGAAGIHYDGWVLTERESLDLLDPASWASCFKPDSLNAILAEHVWEHLTPHEATTAATTCYTFLRPGGHLRVAVPDGLHPDPAYINLVKPGGAGEGSDDHKVLYTHVSFAQLFMDAGFEVQLQEYFDEHGQFHCRDWDPSGGMIRRSKRFDPRNTPERLGYTSIILDAIKPQAGEGACHAGT